MDSFIVLKILAQLLASPLGVVGGRRCSLARC